MGGRRRMSDLESESVSSLFDKGLSFYHELCSTLEPSNNTSYQVKVRTSIEMLEEATRLVSSLDLISTNETVEEVATGDLKFFLLPVLLGDLNMKLNSEDRLSILNVAEIYFKDFLKRCKEYAVSDLGIPDENEIEVKEEPRRPGPMGFEEMAKQREQKIRKFREKKDMESKLIELKKALDHPSYDETVAREYYLLLIKKFILATIGELQTISQEKPIVEHLAKIKSSNVDPQKTVSGLGYPSIPAMTVEELVDQRMKDGWYDQIAGATGQSRSLADDAKNTELAKLKDAQEEIEKERQIEVDEGKDDHRRGWGNRHNMG